MPDSAVHQSLASAGNGLAHLWKHPQRRRDRVELPAAVIGHHQRIGSRVYRAARIVARVDAFDDDGAPPELADPREIAQGDHRLRERRTDVRVQHRSLAREHDIGELHQPAVREETGEPSRPYEELSQEWQLG